MRRGLQQTCHIWADMSRLHAAARARVLPYSTAVYMNTMLIIASPYHAPGNSIGTMYMQYTAIMLSVTVVYMNCRICRVLVRACAYSDAYFTSGVMHRNETSLYVRYCCAVRHVARRVVYSVSAAILM